MTASSLPATADAPGASRPLPAEVYRARVAEATARAARLARIERALVWGRLALLLLALGLLYQACERPGGAPEGAAIGVGLVVAISLAIARLARALGDAEETRRYFEEGIARLEGRGSDRAPTGEAFADEGHLYAADLDLFGRGSLFARLCTARTAVGQQALAGWLKAPADPPEIRARQEAVAELRDRLDLREALWRRAGVVAEEMNAAALGAWVSAPARPVRAGARVAAALIAVAMVPALYLLQGGQVVPFLLLAVVAYAFSTRFRALVAETTRAGQRRSDELRAVAALAALVEGESFHAPRLRAITEALRGGALPAGRRIAQLGRRVAWFESRRNPLFALLSAPFLAGTQLALAIEQWRGRHGADVARWLRAIGELEALASLATYAFEQPTHPFPEIAPEGGPPRYEARALAHPLLPPTTRVANDVSIAPPLRLLMVTGSNMSGKSTLLRAIGANAVLAFAGAPVCAERLTLSPLAIGATLRTQDSLQAGVSRFFAEITRLRDIVALASGGRPALFLLDEILHGTNSKDRHAGAAAIVRALLDRNAIGLVTTHDLALAALVDELAPAASNVHLEDRIEAGRILFDYRLRPGVVTRSNALALMRLVGLEV